MYDFANNDIVPNLKALRERLAKMTDDQLQRFGRSAFYMCDPEGKLGQPPRENFVMQLSECHAEWRRRYAKSTVKN